MLSHDFFSFFQRNERDRHRLATRRHQPVCQFGRGRRDLQHLRRHGQVQDGEHFCKSFCFVLFCFIFFYFFFLFFCCFVLCCCCYYYCRRFEIICKCFLFIFVVIGVFLKWFVSLLFGFVLVARQFENVFLCASFSYLYFPISNHQCTRNRTLIFLYVKREQYRVSRDPTVFFFFFFCADCFLRDIGLSKLTVF